MTPAALHRVAYRAEDDKSFFRIGSALLVAATPPLAPGISCDVFVVFYVVSASDYLSVAAAVAAVCILLGFWIAYPLWRRSVNRGAVQLTSWRDVFRARIGQTCIAAKSPIGDANSLLGKKAVITGADSGIGRVVAIACAREGAAPLASRTQKDAPRRGIGRLRRNACRRRGVDGFDERKPLKRLGRAD